MNAGLWLEFPHHWIHLYTDLDTLSIYQSCVSCAIYTFHRCASDKIMLGPKKVSERTATSNWGVGTLISSRNRKEENSSFFHNHSK